MTAINPSEGVEASLDVLFQAAERACDAGASTTDFEPEFVRLLEFIKQHPVCHRKAERRFLEALSTPSLSWELVTFCMHSLRMQAVRDEACRLIAENKDPRRIWLTHVIDSFSDDWEDAEMYEYYRRGV